MSEQEKNRILNSHEASEKEMEAVNGGGPKIDWKANCISTVKDDSLCWGSDACYGVNNQYRRNKTEHGCSATVTGRSMCSSNDACSFTQIRYAVCASDWEDSSTNYDRA